MRERVNVRARWQRAIGLIALVLLGAALSASGANARTKVETAHRCGYVKSTFGNSGIYPWHMSCAAARKIVVGGQNPKAKTIAFGPGWDGEAVKIDGRYWVCVGQTGYYACGYPYIPKTVKGVLGYRGPFREDVQYRTCQIRPGCPTESDFPQPPAS